MDRAAAAQILGVSPDAPWDEVRRAYRDGMRREHPDARRDGDARAAVALNAAFRTLDEARRSPGAGAPPEPPPPPPPAFGPFGVARLDHDTLALDVPADEAYRVLLDAAHDVGEVTYVDRTGPIIEVLCRFVGEPATSLMLTLQGRATHTEVLCTVVSIEARPAPPTEAVVDLLDDALRSRASASRPWGQEP